MNISFFEKILGFVHKNGKEPILWCELDNIWSPASEYLFPYPEDVTLVTWRNALTPKCIELTRKHGHKLIMAPGEHAYLDYPQYQGDLLKETYRSLTIGECLLQLWKKRMNLIPDTDCRQRNRHTLKA